MHGIMLFAQQQWEMSQVWCVGNGRAFPAHLPEPRAHPSSNISSLVRDMAGARDIEVAIISSAMLRVEAP